MKIDYGFLYISKAIYLNETQTNQISYIGNMSTLYYFTFFYLIGIIFHVVVTYSSDNSSPTFVPVQEINGKPIYDLKDAPMLFMQFIKAYNRNYKDLYDIVVHYNIFKQTLEEINEANSNPANMWTAGIGPMSDIILPNGPG